MTNERAAKIILDLINAGEAEYRNFSVEEIRALKKAYVALNPEPVTNADRIRSMGDEELAEFISDKARTFGEEYEGYMSALDWLMEEVAEDRLGKALDSWENADEWD